MTQLAVDAVVGQHVEVSGLPAVIHAQAIRIFETGSKRAVRNRAQLARCMIEPVEADRLGGAIGRRDDGRRFAAQHEAIAQIDIVHAPVRYDLQPLAGEVIYVQAELLIRADHHAPRGIVAIDPDRRIICCVAIAIDGLCFRHGLDQSRGRRCRAIRVAGFCRQSERERNVTPADEFVVACIFIGDDDSACRKILAERSGDRGHSFCIAHLDIVAADSERAESFACERIHIEAAVARIGGDQIRRMTGASIEAHAFDFLVKRSARLH